MADQEEDAILSKARTDYLDAKKRLAALKAKAGAEVPPLREEIHKGEERVSFLRQELIRLAPAGSNLIVNFGGQQYVIPGIEPPANRVTYPVNIGPQATVGPGEDAKAGTKLFPPRENSH